LIDLVEQLVHGLTLGSLYAMVATGLALMFGVVRLINFAHGEFYMLGGYAFWYAYAELGLPYPVAGLAAVAAMGLFGLAYERAVIRTILPRTWQLLRETVDVLMEKTPKGLDLNKVLMSLLGVAHVRAVHDLHASTVSTSMPVLTAHIVVDDSCFLDGHAPPSARSAPGQPFRSVRRRALHLPARTLQPRRPRTRNPRLKP